jgi:hypothetical protein
MKDWKEEARAMAERAWKEHRANEEAAIEFISCLAKGYKMKIHVKEAYDIVYDAGNSDAYIFFHANRELIRTGGDGIGKDETIDNVILRLAYHIIRFKVEDEYYKIIFEELQEKVTNEI